MRARGEEVRIDDTPEVLTKRLASYRSQTEPLIHYYSERRKLLTVDGMMTIEHVTREINRILAAIVAVEEAKASKKAATKRSAGGVKSGPKSAAGKAAKSTAKQRRRQEARQTCPEGRETGLQGGCQEGLKGSEKVVPPGACGFQGQGCRKGREKRQKGHEKAS